MSMADPSTSFHASFHVLLEVEHVVAEHVEVGRVVAGRVEARRVEAEHDEVAVAHFEVDNSEHRSLFVLTNIVQYASFSSSVGVFDYESVHSSTDVLANYGFDSILSNLDRYWNRIVEHD